MALDKKTRFGIVAALVPIAMVGAAYGSVPLYQLFCQVTGYGGTTQIATAAASQVLERTIKIRFDANVAPGIPWKFAPEKAEVELNLGENGLAFYKVKNESDRAVTAVATYNVTPHKVGPYFQKLECFCFQDRTLQPGESMELPVIFYVDPALATDKNVKEVTEITLSYTFFEAGSRELAQAQSGGPIGAPTGNVTTP
jgi:cytochrome c oxidase assembly protein subunit 11